MAKFRCTGNPIVTVEFTAEHDIETMRKHPEYEEILEETPVKKGRKTGSNEEEKAKD